MKAQQEGTLHGEAGVVLGYSLSPLPPSGVAEAAEI